MERAAFRLISTQIQRNWHRLAGPLNGKLRRYVRRVAARLVEGEPLDALLDSEARQLEADLTEAKGRLPLAFAVHGYNLGGGLMGKRAFALDVAAKEQPGERFRTADELIANRLRPEVDAWIAETSKYETATSSTRMKEIFRQVQRESLTPREMASAMIERGLADSRYRATLMSRTLCAWSYNRGAQDVYRDEGATVGEWMATVDEVTGEWDMALDGQKVPLGEPFVVSGEQFIDSRGHTASVPFDVPHPPLHPHCRCVILPVV